MYFIYFFWFTVCTSIIFFPYCKNLYIFFVFVFVFFFFFVYNVHINHFFLPFCIVRIYVLFFRIRINVLVVLESIIICFIGYFYNTKWKNMTYTQTKLLRSRVLCEEMQSFNEGGEIKRQGYLPFITKRRNKKTKKNLWDRFRRDINMWFYWEWSMNIFQAENKNQIKRWGDWLIDSSLTIQGRNMIYTQNKSKKTTEE